MTTDKLSFNFAKQLNQSRDDLDDVTAKLYSALGMLDDLPENDNALKLSDSIRSAIHSIGLADELIDSAQYRNFG